MEIRNIPKDFWKEYKALNCLERKEKIKFIAKGIIQVVKALEEKPELQGHSISTLIDSYFDDLVDNKI